MLERAAAGLIPCYYSLTGSQPGPAVSQERFVGLGGRGREEEKRKENSPLPPPKIDPELFLGAYSSHAFLFKSQDTGSVQKQKVAAQAGRWGRKMGCEHRALARRKDSERVFKHCSPPVKTSQDFEGRVWMNRSFQNLNSQVQAQLPAFTATWPWAGYPENHMRP